MLQVSDRAPDFELRDADEKAISLAALAGKKVVLYFYPKDDTPGCTTEALQFTAARSEFAALDTVVLGISADDCASHKDFQSKYGLEVLLLSDPGHAVLQDYGVWQEKEKLGVKSMGTVRTTFLIDEEGNIAHIWENVEPEGHAGEVLNVVKSL